MKIFKFIRWSSSRLGMPVLAAFLLAWVPTLVPIVVALTLGSYVISLLVVATGDNCGSGELSLGYNFAKRFMSVVTPFAWTIILAFVAYAVLTLRFNTCGLLPAFHDYA